MYIYICQDAPESILTAIYNIYENKHNFPDTKIMTQQEPMLFAEYVEVEENADKAAKVIRTIRRQFGEEDTHHLFMALASCSADKAQAVYRTIAYGLRNQIHPGHLFDHLTDPYVLAAHKLGLNAKREAQHLKGFLRFQEMENGVLLAVIKPKNHILSELMEHFSDRFPGENFMVHDEGRALFGIHRSRQNSREDWFLVSEGLLTEELLGWKESAVEGYYARLFQHFCKSVAIRDRYNPKLQSSLLPLRFRPYMTEFKNDDSVANESFDGSQRME